MTLQLAAVRPSCVHAQQDYIDGIYMCPAVARPAYQLQL